MPRIRCVHYKRWGIGNTEELLLDEEWSTGTQNYQLINISPQILKSSSNIIEEKLKLSISGWAQAPFG